MQLILPEASMGISHAFVYNVHIYNIHKYMCIYIYIYIHTVRYIIHKRTQAHTRTHARKHRHKNTHRHSHKHTRKNTRIKIPGKTEICFGISAPPAPPIIIIQLSLNEYTDLILSVGRLDGKGRGLATPSY